MPDNDNSNKITGASGTTPSTQSPDFFGFPDPALPMTSSKDLPITQLPPLSSSPSSSPPILTPLSSAPSPVSSLITTLQPYTPSKPQTQPPQCSAAHLPHALPLKTINSSSRPRTSILSQKISPLNLSSPYYWDKYFHIPMTAPYNDNTLLFQKCLQRQVGRVTFHTRQDRSRLVIVGDAIQSQKMHNLKDLQGNPIPAVPDVHLNTTIGTVAVPQHVCPMGNTPWNQCSSDLQDLLSDHHAITSVHCYTIPPRGRRKYPTNIAKIAFKSQTLPLEVYIGGALLKVQPYIPPPRQCQNCWRFGHLAKYCRSAARCPLCAMTSHDRSKCSSQIRTCANCTGQHNVFYRGCPTYKFEAEVAALRFKHGLTLKEARTEARRQGFSSQPLSRLLSNQAFPTTTSHATRPTSTPAGPSSSSTSATLSISSISITPSTSTSVSMSNLFSVLNPETPSSLSSLSHPSLPQRHRSRQTKRSFTSSSSASTIKPSASKPSPTSPPYPPSKKTFTSLSSLPTSPDKIMQDQPIQHVSSPLPSSTSSTVSPNTVLNTTAELHHPPQNLPPTPLPASDTKTCSPPVPPINTPVEPMEDQPIQHVSPIHSPADTMEDQPIQHVSSPLPSSPSTTSPNTVLHTTTEIYHPPQNLPLTPPPASDTKTCSPPASSINSPAETMQDIETYLAQSSPTIPSPLPTSVLSTVTNCTVPHTSTDIHHPPPNPTPTPIPFSPDPQSNSPLAAATPSPSHSTCSFSSYTRPSILDLPLPPGYTRESLQSIPPVSPDPFLPDLTSFSSDSPPPSLIPSLHLPF